MSGEPHHRHDLPSHNTNPPLSPPLSVSLKRTPGVWPLRLLLRLRSRCEPRLLRRPSLLRVLRSVLSARLRCEMERSMPPMAASPPPPPVALRPRTEGSRPAGAGEAAASLCMKGERARSTGARSGVISSCGSDLRVVKPAEERGGA